MLIIPPPKFRKHRRVPRATEAAPPAALTLVAAALNPAAPFIQLQFDRPIDVTGLVGSAITVNDAVTLHAQMVATGTVNLSSAAVVQIGTVTTGPSTGSGMKLTAAALSGIVAVDDGGTWAGVTNLAIPFP